MRDRLSGKDRIVMVLALLVGLDGRVIHGQILDPGGRPPLAFADLASLGSTVQRWLDGAQAAPAAHHAGTPDQGSLSAAALERWLDSDPATEGDPGPDRSGRRSDVP